MQKLVWQNAKGEELDLTKNPFGITQWEGFSNTGLNIQSQQVPFADGSVFLDALMEQRELSVTLAINDENDLYTRYELKRQLISALNPKLGEGYLIYTNDFISKRIKCVAQMPIFPTKNSNDVGTQKASLSWVACEPYWEDLEETVVSMSPNETKVMETVSDVDTPVLCHFSNGAENAVLNINGKEIEISSVDKPCVVSTKAGAKTFNSFELAMLMKSDSIFHAGYLDGYYYFAGGTSVFAQDASANYVMRTKDFEKYEVLDLNLTNAIIYGMGFDDVKKFGIIISTQKLYCYINGEWVERNIPFSSPTSCAVITKSDSLKVFIICGDGSIYVNANSDCSSWNDLSDAHFYKSVKEANFVISGEESYIALTSDGSRIYGIKENGNIQELTTIANSMQNYDFVNGYYYDYANNRRTANFTNWEDITVSVTGGAILKLESLAYNGFLYAGISQKGRVMRSYDGVNFQEVNKLTDSSSNYSGYQILYDKEKQDFLMIGVDAGIESYYKGSLLKIIPAFDFRCSNKIGTISVRSNKLYFNDGNTATTLPIKPVSVTCNEKMFVIMNASANVYVSTDGVNWTFKSRVMNSTTNAKKICWIPKLKLWGVASTDNPICTSLDLESWTVHNSGTDFVDIDSCDGILVAISSDARFATYDGNQIQIYDIAGSETGIKNFCIAANIGKIAVLATGKVYIQDISNMRYTSNVNYWSKYAIDFNTEKIMYAESLGLYFCKESVSWKIKKSENLISWVDSFTNSQNGKLVSEDSSDGEWKIFITTTYSVAFISEINEKNIIDKISGDLDLSLKKRNVITYKNGRNSNLRISFRNKYVGV